MPLNGNTINFPLQGQIGNYEYIGDDLFYPDTLRYLAQGFQSAIPSKLDFLFPAKSSWEAMITVEQYIESYEIMPPVQIDVPNGMYLQPPRGRKFTVTPQPFRENDFISKSLINRSKNAEGQRMTLETEIKSHMQRLMERHQRTRTLFQSKVLLGGWSYFDPRTQVSVNVISNIPSHNLYRYDGWSETATQGDLLPYGGRSYAAFKDLVPVGRNEAGYFISTDGQIGVPWIHPQADITSGVRLLRAEAELTNKVAFTHLIISKQLMFAIQSRNQYLKTWQGFPGMLVNNLPTSTVAGNAIAAASMNGPRPNEIVYGPDGDITSIAGLQVILVDGVWKNPETNKPEMYWPPHKVAMVAAHSEINSAEPLGFTYYGTAEDPNGNPGLYVRSMMQDVPHLPLGWYTTIGDCFMPFPVHPYWICLLDVVDPLVLFEEVPLLKNFAMYTY